jgi:hypothetical protein
MVKFVVINILVRTGRAGITEPAVPAGILIDMCKLDLPARHEGPILSDGPGARDEDDGGTGSLGIGESAQDCCELRYCMV